MIYGHEKPYLVALVYPSDEIGHNKKLVKGIFNKVNLNLSSIKKIRKFHLIKKLFSIESSELTPTLKIKRRIVEKNYLVELNAM